MTNTKEILAHVRARLEALNKISPHTDQEFHGVEGAKSELEDLLEKLEKGEVNE